MQTKFQMADLKQRVASICTANSGYISPQQRRNLENMLKPLDATEKMQIATHIKQIKNKYQGEDMRDKAIRSAIEEVITKYLK